MVRAIASKTAGEDLEQVAVIPAGLEAFGFDPAPGRGLVLQERQRNAPQQGQVVGRVSRAHPALVLPEGDIERPV
jgi:hypothetical protein